MVKKDKTKANELPSFENVPKLCPKIREYVFVQIFCYNRMISGRVLRFYINEICFKKTSFIFRKDSFVQYEKSRQHTPVKK